MSGKIYFVSGIDTDAGKSYATGFLAREWNRGGVRTLTQKLVQTGNVDVSEDILLHRRMMGIPLQPEDEVRLTMPVVYPHPASPHLAAKLAGRPLNLDQITAATHALAARCDAVLLEGAGGLMVPLTEEVLTIDYVKSCGYPVILVTSGKLGSLNHTLLSLEAMKTRGLQLHAMVFNAFPEGDPLIRRDAEVFFRRTLARDWPDATFVNLPILN